MENDRLKAIRIHLKKEQTEFAAALGVKQSFLSEIETGKKQISGNMIMRLNIAFPAISIDWLLKGTGNMLTAVKYDFEDLPPLMTVDPAVLYERIITEKDKQLLYLGKKLKKYEPDGD